MTYVAVDVQVLDRNPLGDPLGGVTVKVLSQDGRLIYGQAVTGTDGIASFLLPAPAVYQARFFKFGTLFDGARLLDVTDDAPLTTLMVYGAPYVYPSATDPRLCAASGFFRSPTGAAAPSVDMHFIPRFDPILLEGAAVLTERATARTDERGYVSVQLIRFGQYDVTLQGMEDVYRTISVPDAPQVNIGDLLFPVVKGITFNEGTTFALGVGDTVTLHPHVFTTDLRELTNLVADLLWSVSDDQVMGFSVLFDTIVLTALRPGSSELRAVRRDQSVVRIPNTPITGLPVSVVVT